MLRDTMRCAVRVGVVALGVAGFISAAQAQKSPEQKKRPPNILFIFSDDHAAHAIGAYGSKINETPNIDRLAVEGMRFENAFCTNSICKPSRAVVLTGKHSHLNGVLTNHDRFDGSQATFPRTLQQRGYQTALLGKWHLGSAPTGFDHYEVLIDQGPYYNPTMRTPKGERKHTGYTTEIITDLAVEWLRQRRADQPFLLMVQHKAPHRHWMPGPDYLDHYDDVQIPEPPTLFDDYRGRTSAARSQEMTVAGHLSPHDLKLTTPKSLTEEQLARWKAAYDPKNEQFRQSQLSGEELVRWKYQRYLKDYLRCIDAVDDGVGRLLDSLDELGLTRNTIVVYSSDQGFYLGDHGWYDKRWMYEESLRMPLIVRWPGVVTPGTTNDALVQNIDFAPTFLEAAEAKEMSGVQGKSLTPFLRGEKPARPWRDAIYYHYLEFPGVHAVQRHFGIRTRTHKLIRYYRIDEWELFDLEKDPDELRSVHSHPDYAEVFDDLKMRLESLQKQLGDTRATTVAGAMGQGKLRKKASSVVLSKELDLPVPDGKSRRGPNPAASPVTVGARIGAQGREGVIVALGGEEYGYSLFLRAGHPVFAVRNEGRLAEVAGRAPLPSGDVHVAATLASGGELRVYVNGVLVGQGSGHLIARRPADGLSIGADSGSLVAEDGSGELQADIREIRVYRGVLPDESLKAWVAGKDDGAGTESGPKEKP